MTYLSFVRTHWRFLGFGFALTFFSSFGQTYFVGMFGGEIEHHFDIGHGDYGLCYMVATVASAATLLWLGRLIDKVDLRIYSVCVCLGVVGASFLVGAANTVALLVVALYALRLTGQGLMGHTAFTSMGRYFDAGRGKAMSIAGLGFQAGNAAFPAIAVALLGLFAWQDAWRVLGVAAAVVMVPTVLWLLRGHAARQRAWEQSTRAEAAVRAVGAAGLDAPRQWTRAEVLRDPRFYLLVPAVLAPPFLLTGFIFHQVHLAAAKGWSLAWLAACFVGFAAVGGVAALAMGAITDRFGARRVVRVYLVPLALSMAVLALFRHPASAAFYLAFAGMSAGAQTPILGSLWVDLYGTLHLGSIRALTSSLMVVSTALAPPIMGWLIDRGVSIESLGWMALGYVCCGLVLISLATRRPG